MKALAVLLLCMSSLLFTGCEEYLWKSNAHRLTSMEQRTELPRLNIDKSLKGSDLNQNGIRDDVDLFIQKNYPQELQQRAVEQFAIILQQSLLGDVSNNTWLRHTASQKSRAIGCIYASFPKERMPWAKDVVQDIIAITTNTRTRFQAYLAFSQALDGKSISLVVDNLCN